MAVLDSYAAHATVLPSDLMEFSADYPGSWHRAVEQALGVVRGGSIHREKIILGLD
jgi:hypothetical protein